MLRRAVSMSFGIVGLLLLGTLPLACGHLHDYRQDHHKGGGGGPDVPRIEASLVVLPADYVGPAPATIRFAGKIRVDRACVVRYSFIGGLGPGGGGILNFPAAGVQQVRGESVLGEVFGRDFRGWAAIRVLSPIEVESPRAHFRVRFP